MRDASGSAQPHTDSFNEDRNGTGIEKGEMCRYGYPLIVYAVDLDLLLGENRIWFVSSSGPVMERPRRERNDERGDGGNDCKCNLK